MPIKGAFMPSLFKILHALRCTDIPIDELAHTKPNADTAKTTPASELDRESPLDPNIINALLSSPYFQTYAGSDKIEITHGVVSFIPKPKAEAHAEDDAEVSALTKQTPVDMDALLPKLDRNRFLTKPRPISSCAKTGNFVETTPRPASA